MPLDITAPPAVEPIPLAEAKARLRVDHTHEDSLISALITAARVRVERLTGHALINQTVREIRDRWEEGDRLSPDGVVFTLARGPVSAVHHVQTVDEDGVAQTLDPASYVLDSVSAPGRLAIRERACWPRPGAPMAGVDIHYDAGHGAASDAVPAPLREAVHLLVADAYERRAPGEDDPAGLPRAVAGLLACYRPVRL